MEGNLHFKIDWASLKVGRKFTVFAQVNNTICALRKIERSPAL